MSQLLVIDGVSVRRDLDGRYCLNDLHRAAVAAGANQPKNPQNFFQVRKLLSLSTY
jgi:hypothetical protein